MRNILIKIEYDGTEFYGWQKQPDRRTVQGELERVLSVLCGSRIAINGTGRTDAGVHAYGQCATFHGEFSIPTENIPAAANNLLSPGGTSAGDVRIISASEVPEGFHARFDAKGKEYKYRIYNDPSIPVFKRNYFYRVRSQLDTEAMKDAAAAFTGTHDFRGFMAAGGTPQESTVRTIYDLSVYRLPGEDGAENEIEISIIGDGFLYNMVRIIAGTLVDVGLHKLNVSDIPSIISGQSRPMAGQTAPPQGLYLARVYFDTEEMMKDVAVRQNVEGI